ncbi:DUF3298 domain-containing protein [Hymenobacter gummosus]|uniref:DUF3298 domain-containing protein n=1 Tax=Hymenobacter gummosus TaxID=1776032 RepID=A0A3S0QI87_9BACT|nr:DUF3298 and DUF4163 domain-containing protein [Hymenobacter gummosus]RTQ50019.1 DUF3298 domain-containing protein [Hymenobacter gummosus]
MSLFLLSRPVLLLALLTACNSRQNDTATTAPAPGQPTAPRPAAPADSPGAWYRQYRGVLPGATDSITLQLQAWPRLTNDSESAGVAGSYAGTDGQPFLLNGDYGTRHAPDSLVLIDYSPEHVAEGAQAGPVWRLHRQGPQLTGTVSGQPVRLREVRPLGSLALISKFYSDSVAAFPNQATSPHAQLRLLALQPVGLATGLLRDNLLRHLCGDTLENQPAPDLDELWGQRLAAYTKDYRQDAGERQQETAGDTLPSYALRYDEQQLMHVFWNQAPLLSLGYFVYSYTGGAHGSYGTRVVSYDTRTGRPLPYSAIFRPGTEPQLVALLDRAARRQLRLAPNAPLDGPLFVPHLPATRNVYLTSGGAVFVYSPYEIASFAQGEIRLFLPFSELRPLLNPDLLVGTAADVADQPL